MESAVERYIRYCEQLVLKGTRPTLDLLVAELGGSRTTAHKALNEFWSSRLPSLLAAREYEEDVPVPVREAVGTLWRTAMADATERAEAAMREAREALDTQRAMLDSTMAEVAAERASFVEVRQMQQAEIARLEADLVRMRGHLEEMDQAHRREQAEAARLRGALGAEQARTASLADNLERSREQLREAEARHTAERERMQREANERLEAVRADAAAAREAAERGHAAAMSELKEGYVNAETRWGVRLDEEKTARKQAERELEDARDKLQQARGANRELREQLAEASKARSRWTRPSLRRTYSFKGR